MHVVVVGGGMAGLTAALELSRAGARPRVTVLEADAQVGGSVRVSDVGGVPVDEGAESLLARRTEAVDVAGQVGLGDDLVAPVTTAAGVWSRGGIHALPPRSLLGVPGSLASLARADVLTVGERLQAAYGLLRPAPVLGDVAVGPWARSVFGPAVTDLLVEPLLGGVYAGQVDELSLEATMPALAKQLTPDRPVLRAVRRSQRTSALRRGPVFQAPVGGVGRLPLALAAELRRREVAVRTRARVQLLARSVDRGWRVVFGSARRSEALLCDAVILALPAHAAGPLLAPLAGVLAQELGTIAYADIGLVTLAYREQDGAWAPPGSGLLVPAVERRTVKAVTMTSRKWGWYRTAAPGTLLVRASVGRFRDARVLDLDDAELVRLVRSDLRDLVRIGAEPRDVRVTRWRQVLPQYEVGHREKVARIRRAAARVPGLAVCGAAYDGVGIPAVIASAREAAHTVLASHEEAGGLH